ncbi:CBO0543 family protein [Halalkalibacter sp. AB-rgal2]|uniref:CBO0543 family protein n=1 Tax=Halalkalibacter sp. AB-rgal2 TaxID=3242695 RepID=UPI00359CE8E2
MRDRNLLYLITAIGMSGWILLFRKRGHFKDWLLIYLFKTLVSTLMDGPVIKRKFVQYPIRYMPKFFDSNIAFLYLIFPMLCVMYNQFTYQMKPVKTFFSVFLFSVPMGVIEHWIQKKTNLIKFNKGWNAYHTITVLTLTFWLVRLFICTVRKLDKMKGGEIEEGAS